MTLIESPSDVAYNGFLAIASAMWTYMTPMPPMPSMHEITTGFYVPNDYDTSQGIKADFGATTNVVSLYADCNTGADESVGSLSRA